MSIVEVAVTLLGTWWIIAAACAVVGFAIVAVISAWTYAPPEE